MDVKTQSMLFLVLQSIHSTKSQIYVTLRDT